MLRCIFLQPRKYLWFCNAAANRTIDTPLHLTTDIQLVCITEASDENNINVPDNS